MDDSKPLKAEDILGIDDRPMEKAEVPEWNGHVFLRTISGAERDAFEAESFRQERPNYQNLRARYLALTLTDENGDRLFNAKQVAELGKKAAPVLDRLFTRAAKINAMSPGDVDELLGNSEAGPTGDSTTD